MKLLLLLMSLIATPGLAHEVKGNQSKQIQGKPLEGVLSESKTSHYHFYENRFNKNINIRTYNAASARASSHSSDLFDIALINAIKEIDFAAHTGLSYTKIEMPYNTMVATKVMNTLLSRGFGGFVDSKDRSLTVFLDRACKLKKRTLLMRLLYSRGTYIKCS